MSEAKDIWVCMVRTRHQQIGGGTNLVEVCERGHCPGGTLGDDAHMMRDA
jgi:hypothetical protein